MIHNFLKCEPRVRRLFGGYLEWIREGVGKGGCIFMALGHEDDERPGPVQDLLVQSQRDWRDVIVRAAGTGVAEGHFRQDLDLEQFAYDFLGIGMAFEYGLKWLRDLQAEAPATCAS